MRAAALRGPGPPRVEPGGRARGPWGSLGGSKMALGGIRAGCSPPITHEPSKAPEFTALVESSCADWQCSGWELKMRGVCSAKGFEGVVSYPVVLYNKRNLRVDMRCVALLRIFCSVRQGPSGSEAPFPVLLLPQCCKIHVS